nr:uncharacterized protein LOC111513503 [Leptinotarsa decemlineata]
MPFGNTVAEKRSTLCDALKREKKSGTVSFPKVFLDPNVEISTCEKKLNDLEQDILGWDQANGENEFHRIHSRLQHLLLRLDRFSGKEVEEEITRLRLVSKCSRLIGEVNLARQRSFVHSHCSGQVAVVHEESASVGASLLDIPNPTLVHSPIEQRENTPVVNDLISFEDIPAHRQQDLLPEEPIVTRQPASQEEYYNLFPGFSSQGRLEPVYPQTQSWSNISRIAHRGYSQQPIPEESIEDITAAPRNWKGQEDSYPAEGSGFQWRDISRWSIRYNGRTSVNDFLERVEELRVSRGVSKTQLLHAAPEIFVQDALLWYRTGIFTSWDDLTEQLRQAFRPYDYEYSLWDEIRRRTQGSQEKVLNFIIAMENLFRKLDHPPDEQARVSLIRRNLLPYLQTQLALQQMSTISDLTRLCRMIEETEMRTQKFVPPPTSYRNLLEPELAYKKPQNQLNVAAVNIRREDRNETSETPPTSTKFLPTLYKKRETGSTVGRLLPIKSPKAEHSKILLDYVLAHAKDDTRPYLKVSIFGGSFLGLLDSGCTGTIIGGPGWNILKSICALKKSTQSMCTVANGQSCSILGTVSVPFKLYDRVKVLDVLVVPSLPHTLILGMDFWRAMEIVPDMFSGEWCFRNDQHVLQPSTMALASIDSLTMEQLQTLNGVIEETFQKMGDRLGCTNLVEHVIRTDHPPIRQRYYPLSHALHQQVDQELEKMLRDGVIEPSQSPWASPILLIKKNDGSYRFVVDFRELNKVTIRDAYPLPMVSATLDKLRNSHYLTTLDIKSAYWQIPLSEQSKPLTAFVVPNRGLYQFRRMPMGLHNAPATWQRFMDRVVGIDLEQYVFVYLDDVIICSPTFAQHLVLREVLTRLTRAGLTLNREKCHFCKSELRYLGYVVGAGGLMVDPSKVEAILQITAPKSVSDVRRLIGLASWYRRFVPNFSSLTAPLCNLLRKGQKFVWDLSCEEALASLKNHLISAPILTCPDFAKPFTVQTDASDFGLGAVLTQQDDDGEKVISYLSRSLSKAERKYSTTEKECLAVLFAIEKFRPYIEGTKFAVVTDPYSLKWLNQIKDPVGRIARWAVRLQQYDFEIIHRKGKEHVVPDALSRSVPCVDAMESDGTLKNSKDTWYKNMCTQVTNNPE